MKTLLLGLVLSSPAFHNNADIPVLYTCDGSDQSPPLTWSGLPPTSKSLVLIMDDPDAQHGNVVPGAGHTHWILYNIPIDLSYLARGQTPPGASLGVNDSRRKGYSGPCPPTGRHHYRFKLYALDVLLPNLKYPKQTQIYRLMQTHVLAQAELIGLYQKNHQVIQNSVYWMFNWRLMSGATGVGSISATNRNYRSSAVMFYPREISTALNNFQRYLWL